MTIGVPVYNGERHLAAALDAILGQTYANIEVIISDNASTDDTERICRAYVERDRRVSYIRNSTNIGGPANFNQIVGLASRRYFKWAAHDDLIAPEYLHRCVAVLDANADVSLASTRVAVVDDNGAVIKPLGRDISAVRSRRAHDRLRDFLFTRHGNFHFWGVMRTELVAAAGGHDTYPAGDRVLVAAMTLRGRIHLDDDRLFFTRNHSGRTVHQLRSVYRRTTWHDPGHSGRIYPHWGLAARYLRQIRAAPLARRERLACMLVWLAWLGRNWTWARMILDLLVQLHPGFIDAYERIATRAKQRRREAVR